MDIAILLTVYNRKETTIHSLNSLYNLINKDLYNSYDIYMTNDGCTDGTEESVKQLYPQINIINHKGNLFSSRGINLAWKTAIKTKEYDYFLWFNDDATLYPNALEILLHQTKHKDNTNTIITGAFCDSNGNVSYGGKNKLHQLITPNGKYQEVYYMNGNFVIIPNYIYKELGIIDKIFTHGLGDYDYGLRAQKKGLKVLLTPEYIGETNRHDNDLMPYFSYQYSILERFKFLYAPKYSTIPRFKFTCRYKGFFRAIISFLYGNICTLFPFIHSLRIKI